MKKALIVVGSIVAAIGLLLWIASWFRADDAVATSAARAWPNGMGNLAAVDSRLLPMHSNEASRKLTALATSLPQNDIVENFVSREIARGDSTIGAPPALPDVTAIRDLALREAVTWERHPGIDHKGTSEMRGVQMRIARALIANALSKARGGDAAAWDSLHAAWKLSRALDGHPQVMAQTAVLSTARMINAVAWKMPLPVPAWFAEVQARDNVRTLLESFQYQVSSYQEDGARLFPTKWLAASVEHDRLIAEELSKISQCDVNASSNELGVDLANVWRRAFRYRAEREATANALRLREGKPIESRSLCSDGTWSFDGTTLRFSRPIAMQPSDKSMPLVLRVK